MFDILFDLKVVIEMLSRKEEIERSIITKFRKEIWRPFTKAVREYQLIQEGDKVAVCISGGKDSMLLAKCIEELQKHGKVKFDVCYIVMNPGYRPEIYEQVLENAKILGIDIQVFSSNIFDVVDSQNSSPCYLCARMRRGFLYARAQELGCNKIALGHHFDDVIETILLSIFYGGEYKSMPPKLWSTNFDGMELIRPLYLIREDAIIRWAKYNQLDFINCACKFTNSSHIDSKRLEMKNLIHQFEKKNPHVAANIFKSSENVNIETILGIKKDGKKISFLDNYDR